MAVILPTEYGGWYDTNSGQYLDRQEDGSFWTRGDESNPPTKIQDATASPAIVDWQRYLNENPDVAASGMSGAGHWLQYGKNEGRQIHTVNKELPWTYSALGDVRRVHIQDAGGDFLTEGRLYNRGAGNLHPWLFEQRDANGNWNLIDPGEHEEAAIYYWVGVNSPEYVAAKNAVAAGNATALEKARVADPEATGMAIYRPDHGGTQENRELAYMLQDGTAKETGLKVTAEQLDAAVKILNENTPAAQAAREGDDGGFGAILAIAAIAAAIYSGGAAAGLWGAAAEGAGAAAAGTAAAVETGAIAAGVAEGAGAAAAGTAAAGAGTAAAGGFSFAVDQALISAGMNAAGQLAFTGEIDPSKVLLSGLVSGVNPSGFVSKEMGLDGAAKAAMNAGINSTTSNLVQGADFEDAVKRGLISAAGAGTGAAVKEFVNPTPGQMDVPTAGPSWTNTAAGAASGAASAIASEVLTGSSNGFASVITGMAGGLVKDLLAGTDVSQNVVNATAGLVGTLVSSTLAEDKKTPDVVPHNVTTPTPTPTPTPEKVKNYGGIKFGKSNATFRDVREDRKDMAWGSRWNNRS